MASQPPPDGHRDRSFSLNSVGSFGSALGSIFGQDFELEVTYQSDDDAADVGGDEGGGVYLDLRGGTSTEGAILGAIRARLDALHDEVGVDRSKAGEGTGAQHYPSRIRTQRPSSHNFSDHPIIIPAH